MNSRIPNQISQMASSSSAKASQVLKGVQSKATNLINGAKEMDLRQIMRMHAFTSIVLGVGTLLLPHAFLGTGYSHFSHEFIRLYGCLTLSIGWVVWKSQGVKDGRLARALTETFAISYCLQSIVMLRAQFTHPEGHTTLHWMIGLAFGVLGLAYLYIRWVKKIKYFALPNEHDDE